MSQGTLLVIKIGRRKMLFSPAAKMKLHFGDGARGLRVNCAMGLFGKRRQEERDNAQNEERIDIESAIAAISGRLRFLEALTSELVAELPQTRRDRLLQQLRDVVGELKVLPPPAYVPPGREREFHNVLGSALQVLIEKTSNLKPRPKSR